MTRLAVIASLTAILTTEGLEWLTGRDTLPNGNTEICGTEV